jgi:hypothetical protein
MMPVMANAMVAKSRIDIFISTKITKRDGMQAAGKAFFALIIFFLERWNGFADLCKQ